MGIIKISVCMSCTTAHRWENENKYRRGKNKASFGLSHDMTTEHSTKLMTLDLIWQISLWCDRIVFSHACVSLTCSWSKDSSVSLACHFKIPREHDFVLICRGFKGDKRYISTALLRISTLFIYDNFMQISVRKQRFTLFALHI